MTSVSVSVMNLWPSFCKLLLQREVVLDDAVVDDDDIAFAIAVRMGVLFGRPAVRCPTRVADAIESIDRAGPNDFFQIPQLARGAADRQSPTGHPALRCPRNRSRGIPAAAIRRE